MNKSLDSWLALGRFISSTRPDMIGGVTIGRESDGDTRFSSNSDVLDSIDGQRISTTPTRGGGRLRIFDQGTQLSNFGSHMPLGRFGILFPTLNDLTAFSQAACGLVINGYHIDTLLYAQADTDQNFITTDTCALYFETSASGSNPADTVVPSWLTHLSGPPDVFIALTTADVYTNSLLRAVQSPALEASVVVRLAGSDLSYSDWMGTLSLVEWKRTSNQSLIFLCALADFRVVRLECTSCGCQYHHKQQVAIPVASTSFLGKCPVLRRLP